MTEIDYSPAAYERYMATQKRIAKWVDNTQAHVHEFRAPAPPIEVTAPASPPLARRRSFVGIGTLFGSGGSSQRAAQEPHHHHPPAPRARLRRNSLHRPPPLTAAALYPGPDGDDELGPQHSASQVAADIQAKEMRQMAMQAQAQHPQQQYVPSPMHLQMPMPMPMHMMQPVSAPPMYSVFQTPPPSPLASPHLRPAQMQMPVPMSAGMMPLPPPGSGTYMSYGPPPGQPVPSYNYGYPPQPSPQYVIMAKPGKRPKFYCM